MEISGKNLLSKVELDWYNADHIREHIDLDRSKQKTKMSEEDVSLIPELIKNADYILYQGKDADGNIIKYKNKDKNREKRVLFIKRKNGYNLVVEVSYPKKEDGVYKPFIKTFYPIPKKQADIKIKKFWKNKARDRTTLFRAF
jgi:hypothetical protein